MAKKSKYAYKIPKRVLGVRMPKGVRRFAASPLGAAILADVIVSGAAAVARRPQLSGVFGQMGDEARLAGRSGAEFLAHLARAAATPFKAAVGGVGDQQRGRSQLSAGAGMNDDMAAREPDWNTPAEDRRAADRFTDADTQPRM